MLIFVLSSRLLRLGPDVPVDGRAGGQHCQRYEALTVRPHLYSNWQRDGQTEPWWVMGDSHGATEPHSHGATVLTLESKK